MQCIQHPAMLPTYPGSTVEGYGRPVSVTCGPPGSGVLHVWSVQDDKIGRWRVRLVQSGTSVEGEFLASVEIQAEYGIVGHVFVERL